MKNHKLINDINCVHSLGHRQAHCQIVVLKKLETTREFSPALTCFSPQKLKIYYEYFIQPHFLICFPILLTHAVTVIGFIPCLKYVPYFKAFYGKRKQICNWTPPSLTLWNQGFHWTLSRDLRFWAALRQRQAHVNWIATARCMVLLQLQFPSKFLLRSPICTRLRICIIIEHVATCKFTCAGELK